MPLWCNEFSISMCPGGEIGRRKGLKVRSGQSFFRVTLKPCGRGGIGRRIGLKRTNLSARRETGDAELLKFGEPCNMAIPSQARPETAGKV